MDEIGHDMGIHQDRHTSILAPGNAHQFIRRATMCLISSSRLRIVSVVPIVQMPVMHTLL
jgi:hypothetical protein